MDLKTLEAAATWYVQLNDGANSEARTQAWRQWLQASPLHAAAWARVEKLQQQWAMVPPQAALSGLGAAQAQRRDVLKVLGLLMAMGGGSWLAAEQVPHRALLAQHSTRSGERRALHLEDGSASANWRSRPAWVCLRPASKFAPCATLIECCNCTLASK